MKQFQSNCCCEGSREERDPVNPPLELYQHINKRQFGYFLPFPKKTASDFVSRNLPKIYKERQFKLGEINKIFAAQWISNKQVLFGTKCNKVMIS